MFRMDKPFLGNELLVSIEKIKKYVTKRSHYQGIPQQSNYIVGIILNFRFGSGQNSKTLDLTQVF